MEKQKKKRLGKLNSLIVVFTSLLFLTLSLSGFTFAWINRSQTINSVVDIQGSKLVVGNVNATVYKYVYPSFNVDSSAYDINYELLNSSSLPTGEQALIDYNKDGAVRTKALDSSFAIKMNVFDPQYLLLNRYNKDASGNPDPETISDLNTNLVVGVSFDVTYSFPIEASLQVTKKARTTSNLPATNYLHYCGVLATEGGLGLAVGDSVDSIFSKVKTYSETTAENHNFLEDDTNNDSRLNMIENAVIDSNSIYSSEVTNTFTIYLNIDFDEYLTGVKKYDTDGLTLIDDYDSKLFGIDYLGKTKTVEMDYYFTLSVSQHVASGSSS